MKLLFVVNPISGGVDKEPFLKEAEALCKKYGITYRIFKTTGKNDEEGVKEALNAFNPDKVVSCGGDGTTLFTALCLLGTEFPMGIIPLGSANGMATELFVNPKPIEALKDIIMSDVVSGLDLLKINDTYHTLHIGDVGINAQIVESYEKDPNRGMATYAKYFIKELSQLKPFNITITCNGESKSFNTLMSGICNARKYGTGVPLNLNGNPMDGKFELVLVNKLNANTLLKSGLSKFDEAFFDNKSNEIIVTDYAEIEFEEPRLLQLDGEVIGKFDKLKIEILAGAINFITHNDNIYV